jgi:hypothetical protein
LSRVRPCHDAREILTDGDGLGFSERLCFTASIEERLALFWGDREAQPH